MNNKISIIAINITNDNILLNKDNLPILFYWNKDDGNIVDCIYNDMFKNALINLCKGAYYTTAKINLVYFEDEDINVENNEKFSYESYLVQDILNIKDNPIMGYKIIIDLLNDLYINIFKHSYDISSNSISSINNAKDVIHTMYSAILTSSQDKLTSNTVFHYILSKLQNNKQLTKDNLNSIILLSQTILL